MRLVDSTDECLAELLPAELAVELGAIAGLCREGLMAVAVEAGLATAMAMMRSEAEALCGGWNARDPERTHVPGRVCADLGCDGRPETADPPTPGPYRRY